MLKGDTKSSEFKFLRDLSQILKETEILLKKAEDMKKLEKNFSSKLKNPSLSFQETKAKESIASQSLTENIYSTALMEQAVNNIAEIQPAKIIDQLSNTLAEKLLILENEKMRDNIIWVIKNKNDARIKDLRNLGRKAKRTEIQQKLNCDYWQNIYTKLCHRVEEALVCGNIKIAAGLSGSIPAYEEFASSFVVLKKDFIEFYEFINEDEPFYTLQRESIERIFSFVDSSFFTGFVLNLKASSNNPEALKNSVYLLCDNSNDFLKWSASLFTIKTLDSLNSEQQAPNFCSPTVYGFIDEAIKQRIVESNQFRDEFFVNFQGKAEITLEKKLNEIALKSHSIDQLVSEDYLEEMINDEMKVILGLKPNAQSQRQSKNTEDATNMQASTYFGNLLESAMNTARSEKETDSARKIKAEETEQVVKAIPRMGRLTPVMIDLKTGLQMLKIGYRVLRYYAYKTQSRRLLTLNSSMYLEFFDEVHKIVEDSIKVNEIENIDENITKNLEKSTKPKNCISIRSSKKKFELEFLLANEKQDFCNALVTVIKKNYEEVNNTQFYFIKQKLKTIGQNFVDIITLDQQI